MEEACKKKPQNPYRKGSSIWSVFEGDWADLTLKQIGEVLDIPVSIVYSAVYLIKKKTGYDVPHS